MVLLTATPHSGDDEAFYNLLGLLNPDFVRLAESFGVRAARATSPGELEGLLRESFGGSSEPVLIEVPVGPMPNPFQTLRQARAPARA